VFGSALAEQDQHLVDAINDHPKRPVAVSMRPAKSRVIKRNKALIASRLDTDRLYFYNAETHPLGAPQLRAATAPDAARAA
jgi:hypothetical protein